MSHPLNAAQRRKLEVLAKQEAFRKLRSLAVTRCATLLTTVDTPWHQVAVPADPKTVGKEAAVHSRARSRVWEGGHARKMYGATLAEIKNFLGFQEQVQEC